MSVKAAADRRGRPTPKNKKSAQDQVELAIVSKPPVSRSSSENIKTMRRYLVRQGNTGRGWLVWDRVRRGPAVVDGREVTRLSRENAYAAVALLDGPRLDGKKVPVPTAWQVIYSGIIVDCRDEQDAKSLAQELVKKGFRVRLKRQ